MPTRTPTIATAQDGPYVIVTWSGLLNGDDGAPITYVDYPDRTAQVTGTFGAGGNLRIEGSVDGTNYAALTDPQGNDINITAAKLELVTEIVKQIRPRVTAGDGTTSLVCSMILRRSMR